MPEGPLTTQELRLSLEQLNISATERVAVAVSGGADSLCLAVLLHKIQPIVALIVDHGLRPESANEAQQTFEKLQALGMQSEILVWRHDKVPTGNIQAAARESRYELMRDWCKRHQIKFLCTAHHMDDQAETVLLRLARGSGVYGLAGMSEKRDLGEGVVLVRPVLDVSKQRLVAALMEQNLEWVDDPSNQNAAFDRVKVRNFLANPPLEGLRADRLAATAERLRRSRKALEFYQHRWLLDAVEFFDEGYAVLDRRQFVDVPEDISLRAMNSVIQFAGGGGYAPRFEKLLRLTDALLDENFKGYTLSGVQFTPLSACQILVSREKSALAPPETIDEGNLVWDNRFSVDVSNCSSEHNLLIGPLEDHFRSRPDEDLTDLKEMIDNIPKVVLPTLPAFFEGERLIAVPHLGYKVANINTPILSHQWLSLSEIGKKTYGGMQ